MKAKPFFVTIPIIIFCLLGCNNANNTVTAKTDTIPIETTVKLFFSEERKNMDDIETLDVDTITVLKYAKLNDTAATATLKITGLLQPAPSPLQKQPARYFNTMDWKFYKQNNNWKGIPVTGWIQ